MSEHEVVDNLQYLLEHYREYDIRISENGTIYIGNVLSIIVSKQTIIDTFYVVNLRAVCGAGETINLLNKLIDACQVEFLKRHNKLTEQYADAKKQIEKMEKRETWLFSICITLMIVLGAFGVYGVRKQNANKSIEKAVKQYEQALPGYLEQKQAVANYRDSLRNTKTK